MSSMSTLTLSSCDGSPAAVSALIISTGMLFRSASSPESVLEEETYLLSRREVREASCGSQVHGAHRECGRWSEQGTLLSKLIYRLARKRMENVLGPVPADGGDEKKRSLYGARVKIFARVS